MMYFLALQSVSLWISDVEMLIRVRHVYRQDSRNGTLVRLLRPLNLQAPRPVNNSDTGP
jgi:hypothetical protein